MDRGLAPCEKVLEQHALLPADFYEASWEVGRLVLAPQYRTGPEALKRCLFLTLVHLIRTTNINNVFAVCSPLLSRLYRRFGCTVIVKDACEGADGTLSIIHGRVSDVLVALATTNAEKSWAANELRLAGKQLMGMQ